MGKHKKNRKRYRDRWEKEKSKILRFKTRDELFDYLFPRDVLDIWYPTDEEKEAYKKYFFERHELYLYEEDDPLDDLRKDEERRYKKKLNKLLSKESFTYEQAFISLNFLPDEIEALKYKSTKHERRAKYDMSIASLMRSKTYRKCYFDNDEYRRELKKIAKCEEEEIEEGKRLGYIKSGRDLDKELKKLDKLLATNESLSRAMDDDYTQKFFVD